MSAGEPEPPAPGIRFGTPSDDPLAARLFPRLPGVVRWGLERTVRLLAALDDPQRKYPVLHVGGTNGKGSVARIWAGILQAAGFRTGLYTSPDLISFRERILVDGRPIPDRLLEEWSRDLRPFLLREAPSYFEAATALAFLVLARAEVDVAVVEVGLGGRLDATNVVQPVLTAITNVAVEHAEFLGDDVASIAREKGGILKPGVPAYTSCDDPAALSVLLREAAALGAILRRVPRPEGTLSLDGTRLRLETGRWGPLELASPLVGDHQLANLALAVRSLESFPPRLPVTGTAVEAGVRRTRVPGRFQVEREAGRTWILDVAHNLHAAEALGRSLELLDPPRPRVGVVGIVADKPAPEMLSRLGKVLDLLLLTVPPSMPPDRRWDPRAVVKGIPGTGVRVHEDFPEALAAARDEAGAGGTVVVTGSHRTVGDALRALDRVPPEAVPLRTVGGRPGA